MSSTPINLGHIDLKAGPHVFECEECHSRKVKTVPGEVTKEYIAEFVRTRAHRLGIALADHDIKVDKNTGLVTATPKKDVEFEFDFS